MADGNILPPCMSITVDQFYSLLIEEIKARPQLQGYYRFLHNPKKELWRKAYFCQRLEYIERHVKGFPSIWDIGCGYGTTAIFLVLNGYKVHGTTLEYYFHEIQDRIKYWSQFGDLSGFTFDYENLYDTTNTSTFDAIIVQDTIHHTEPVKEALRIIHDALRPGGRIIAVEENGRNIIQRMKLYKQRGNKRIIEFYDERLKKTILLGNENIRSLDDWRKLFDQAGLPIEDDTIEYVRVLPAKLFGKDYASAVAKEQKMWRRNSLLRDYFFFGLSFCGRRG
jgi:SAM-dependent methyltransferase